MDAGPSSAGAANAADSTAAATTAAAPTAAAATGAAATGAAALGAEAVVDSREAILDAAERLMARIGYAQASIAKICKESGLPTGSIYHYFGSKAGLLAAVIERGQRRFLAAMPDGHDCTSCAEDAMRDYWTAAADAITSNADYFRLDSDLSRLQSTEPLIASVATDWRRATAVRLAAVIEPVAREAGVPDALRLSERLARVTMIFTRGAMPEAGRDAERLRVLIADLYEVLRLAIMGAAAQSSEARAQPGAP